MKDMQNFSHLDVVSKPWAVMISQAIKDFFISILRFKYIETISDSYKKNLQETQIFFW